MLARPDPDRNGKLSPYCGTGGRRGTFWAGQATGRLWAAPPAGHPYPDLIEAGDLTGMIAAVEEVEGRQGPR